MKKILFVLFFSLIVNTLLQAQVPLPKRIAQPKRIEIELEDNGDFYNVISAKENGLILFRETKDKIKEGYLWEVITYDTALNEQLNTKFPIAFGDQFIGYEYENTDLYLLYKKGQYNNKDLFMLRVSLDNGDTSHYYIEKLFPIELTEFMIFNNSILFGGYVNLRPAVVYYGLEEKRMRVLPGFYNNNSELLEINIDKKNNVFSVSMAEKMPNKRFKITIKTFDTKGKLLGSRSILPKENLSFITGRSSTLKGGAQFIAGTYAHRRSEYSRGIYFARLPTLDDEEKKIFYYNYADLENFFSYMKAKREIRVKSRIERRKIQNKKIKFNYRLLIHDIFERDGQFIILGEAYYPKYHSYQTNPIYMNYYGPDFHRSGEAYRNFNFAGYKYTHAVIIAFDKTGKVLWDNSFEINDVTSFTLDQFVQPSIQDDQIVLLYIYENVIRSKIIRGNEILEGKVFNDIQLKFEDDVIKNNELEFGGIEKWYNDYFFAYGVQRIKNLRDKDVKLNRKVFFINKVIYE